MLKVTIERLWDAEASLYREIDRVERVGGTVFSSMLALERSGTVFGPVIERLYAQRIALLRESEELLEMKRCLAELAQLYQRCEESAWQGAHIAAESGPAGETAASGTGGQDRLDSPENWEHSAFHQIFLERIGPLISSKTKEEKEREI